MQADRAACVYVLAAPHVSMSLTASMGVPGAFAPFFHRRRRDFHPGFTVPMGNWAKLAVMPLCQRGVPLQQLQWSASLSPLVSC
jgi:hypothetical protein